MIELFVIKETEWLELVTESVSLEGQRYQAAAIDHGQNHYETGNPFILQRI